MVDTGLAEYVLPEVPAMRLAIDEHMQHKDVYTHSLVVMEQAIDRETDGPDLVLRLAALLHDIGKPDTRRKEPDGRVSFHHHEVVGAKMVRRRLRELRYAKSVVDDVAQLVFLHLRFHGYGNGRVDRLGGAPLRHRRRAAAGAAAQARPLRLHDAQPQAGPPRCSAPTTGSRSASRALREQEELDSIRPDLDGNAIMELLGLPPGPLVGKAYKHLLALRMERGPLGHDEAEAELRRWAAEQDQ